MDIKISCIIPFHNDEKELLLCCINSILGQDFEDYEVLIVDDGSDKAHAAYLEEVRAMDDRIRILTQSQLGVSAARNKAMQEAKGDYVAFVDADDFVVPYFFSEAYRIVVEKAANYVVGGTVATHTRNLTPNRVESPKVIECDATTFRTDFLVVTETMQDGGYFGRGPVARLIKRETAAQIPFPENVTLGEDSIWNMDVLEKCDTVYKVYQIWYVYWQHVDSTCHQYDEEIIGAIEEHLKELASRIDFDNEGEGEAYFLRMYEFLRQQIFGCYLGRKECPLSVRERARIFKTLVKREPCNLYEGHMDPKQCDRRTRGKYRLVRHPRMLFRFWNMRGHVRGNRG